MTDYANLRKIVTGDIIVKCRFGNDIRRIPINQVPTYDELCLMMYRVFKQDIKSSEDITLKYQDEEGDMISLLDDIDITHAISISNLLKITIYDKSNKPKQQQQIPIEISSLIDIRDRLDQLIQALSINKQPEEIKEEQVKKIHRLTPAELASFLTNDTEAKEKSSVKELTSELTSLSPKAPSSGFIPYYPPPSDSTSASINGNSSTITTPNVTATNQSQTTPQQSKQPQIHQPQAQQPQVQHQHQQQPQIQQQQQQQQQQHSQLQQIHHQYIQTPPPAGQLSKAQPLQQPRPPQTPQSFNHVNQQFNNVPHYPLPNNDPRSQQQQQPQPQPQQQQPPQQRQGYYVPPPPASMNTPQVPPQPFRPPQHW